VRRSGPEVRRSGPRVRPKFLPRSWRVSIESVGGANCFLDIAHGSLNESRNHIKDAWDRRLIGESERDALDSLATRAVGAVAGLQRYLRRCTRKRRRA
jgi:hypothetical protein